MSRVTRATYVTRQGVTCVTPVLQALHLETVASVTPVCLVRAPLGEKAEHLVWSVSQGHSVLIWDVGAVLLVHLVSY